MGTVLIDLFSKLGSNISNHRGAFKIIFY